MQITVKLFASLRTDRFKLEVWDRPEGTTVADVAAELEIPVDEIGTILVNSRHAALGHTLSDGDTCALFPLIGGG